MEVLQVPVLSIGHITAQDAAELEELAGSTCQPISVASDRFSFWLSVPDDAASPTFQALIKVHGLSASVTKVMTWAAAHGHQFVRLDSDGELLDEEVTAGVLDAHDW